LADLREHEARVKAAILTLPTATQTGTLAALSEALHAKTVQRTRAISSAELLAWGASGPLDDIDRACVTTSDVVVSGVGTFTARQIRAAAKAARIMVERDSTAFDPFLADRGALLQLLVVSGFLPAQAVAELQSLATYTISQLEAAGAPYPCSDDVITKARS
jgi:hypothetical protein